MNWGVLSTAKLGREKVIPGMQKGSVSRLLGIASRDRATAQAAAHSLGIPPRLWQLRGPCFPAGGWEAP